MRDKMKAPLIALHHQGLEDAGEDPAWLSLQCLTEPAGPRPWRITLSRPQRNPSAGNSFQSLLYCDTSIAGEKDRKVCGGGEGV